MARSPLYRGPIHPSHRGGITFIMRSRRLLVCTLFKNQEPRLRPPKSSFPASHLADATDYPSKLSRPGLAVGLVLAFVALFATAAQVQTTDPILSCPPQ